jgi:hypothetical protein
MSAFRFVLFCSDGRSCALYLSKGEFRVKCPNGTVAYFREEEINYWDEGEENKRIAVSSPPAV